MTINQLFNRFLKENKLYGHVFNLAKEQKQINKDLGYKRYFSNCALTYANDLFKSNYSFSYFGPEFLIMYLFQYHDKMFSGDSKSSNRQKLYRLNRKWKDFLKNKVVIQHNINKGDIVTATYSSTSLKHKYSVFSVSNDKSCSFIGNRVDFGGRYRLSLFSVKELEDKEVVINVYLKDKNGNCYGKIEGDFNEIQL